MLRVNYWFLMSASISKAAELAKRISHPVIPAQAGMTPQKQTSPQLRAGFLRYHSDLHHCLTKPCAPAMSSPEPVLVTW